MLDQNHSYVFSDLDSEDSRKSVSGEFKYGMSWQNRGSGICYDSRSGVGTTIGNRTGTTCANSIRLKDCKVCSYYNSKGNSPPDHKCARNWNVSAKSMGPYVGAELVKEIEKNTLKLGL